MTHCPDCGCEVCESCGVILAGPLDQHDEHRAGCPHRPDCAGYPIYVETPAGARIHMGTIGWAGPLAVLRCIYGCDLSTAIGQMVVSRSLLERADPAALCPGLRGSPLESLADPATPQLEGVV